MKALEKIPKEVGSFFFWGQLLSAIVYWGVCEDFPEIMLPGILFFAIIYTVLATVQWATTGMVDREKLVEREHSLDAWTALDDVKPSWDDPDHPAFIGTKEDREKAKLRNKAEKYDKRLGSPPAGVTTRSTHAITTRSAKDEWKAQQVLARHQRDIVAAMYSTPSYQIGPPGSRSLTIYEAQFRPESDPLPPISDLEYYGKPIKAFNKPKNCNCAMYEQFGIHYEHCDARIPSLRFEKNVG